MQAFCSRKGTVAVVIATGLHNHVTWKNKKIWNIFNAVAGLSASQGVTYEYHHMGIPTKSVQQGEKYSPTFKMYTTAGDSERGFITIPAQGEKSLARYRHLNTYYSMG